MARLTSLLKLREMLRAECGDSITVGVGTQINPTLNVLLSNMQQWLAGEYDWPFLEARWDVGIVAGTRYYPLPTTTDTGVAQTRMNVDRPIKVEVKYNQRWQEVSFGIGFEEYNYIDSDQGSVLDPVQRWRYSDENQDTFEVWPIAAGNGQILRFTGQRVLNSLVADADLADLDDQLLVLFCAAELLSRRKQSDAQLKLQKAQLRLARQRGVLPGREESFIIGKNRLDSTREPRRGVPLVVVHG